MMRFKVLSLEKEEYKELHTKHHGVDALNLGKMVEEEIVERYVSAHLVDKEFSKIENWSSKSIPRLLDTVFYCLIIEELWNVLKEHKNPTINFKTLKALTIQRIKQLKPEIF